MQWLEKCRTYTQVQNDIIDKVATKYKANRFISSIICERNDFDLDKISFFLATDFKPLPPSGLKDMDKATDIILDAMSKNQKIRVESDFDCDGLFSTYILIQLFDALEYKNFSYHIPHREKDGYGLSVKAVNKAYEDGVSLIITVDNGIAAFEAVDRANELGIGVIVTDHHTPFEQLPNSLCIVNPHQKDCTYPQKMLSGGMVAYKLVQSLINRSSREAKLRFMRQGYNKRIISAAALSAIADVMDILGENRSIVKEGFKYLKEGAIPAVAAIMPEPSVYRVSFGVAPRFNSMGRLHDMTFSLDYLLETNPAEIEILKEQLEDCNNKRKDMQLLAHSTIRDRVLSYEQMPKIIIEVSDDMHESLAGLVAGKLKEEFYRPVIIFAKTSSGTYKASGRSIPEYNIIKEVTPFFPLISGGGGHAMACGLKADTLDQIEAFKEALISACTLTEDQLTPKLTVDKFLSFNDDFESIYYSSKLLEPFGTGNPELIYAMRNVRLVTTVRSYKRGEYAKIKIYENATNTKYIIATCWDENVFKINNENPPMITMADICFTMDYSSFSKTIEFTIKSINYL